MPPLSDITSRKSANFKSDYKDPKNKDVTIPITTPSAPFNPNVPESITNNFEVKIGTHQKEFSKLTKTIVCLSFVVQTVLYTAIIMILYMRISILEQETSRLALQAAEKQALLQGLSDQITDVRHEFRDMTLECSFYDNNSTDSDQDSENWIEVEMDYYDADYDALNDDSDRFKRATKNGNQNSQKKNMRGNQQKQQWGNNGRKGRNKKKLICRKCNPDRRNGGFKSIASVLASDISAVHLKGSLPEVDLKDRGTIGPWYDVSKSTKKSDAQDFELETQNSSVHVLSDGYYFIYAQVYYLSSGSNSFSIIKKPRNAKGPRNPAETLATCSSTSANHSREEVSCFTATVGFLKRHDTLQLVEREINKHVLFRDGQTYFGLMKLSPNSIQNFSDNLKNNTDILISRV